VVRKQQSVFAALEHMRLREIEAAQTSAISLSNGHRLQEIDVGMCVDLS
jgi:hypothetical protein